MATIPNPRTWTASEAVTTAKLNTDIRDGLNFFFNPPRAFLSKNADQNFGTGVEGVILWETETYDTDNGHSTVTNPGRYTAQTAGWYYLIVNVHWRANNDLGMREIVFKKNGLAAGRQNRQDEWPGYGHLFNTVQIRTSGHMQMNVGDYVEVCIYQNSGSGSTVYNEAGNPPYFSVRWVHP